jgi:hypothetical protein
VRGCASLDAIFEYMRPDERYRLLADEHAEKAKKSDRGRCRRPHLNQPIYDSDCYTQDKRSEIRSHRMLLGLVLSARAPPLNDLPVQPAATSPPTRAKLSGLQSLPKSARIPRMLSYYEEGTRAFSSWLPFQQRHRHRSLDPTTISEPVLFANSLPQNLLEVYP